MKLSNLVAVLAIAVAPALVPAQAHLPNLGDRLKVHPRRLAVNQKGGRRQIRVMSHKQRHQFRKSVRGVTHHATTPHHPNRH